MRRAGQGRSGNVPNGIPTIPHNFLSEVKARNVDNLGSVGGKGRERARLTISLIYIFHFRYFCDNHQNSV